jgi:hypothetical protein
VLITMEESSGPLKAVVGTSMRPYTLIEAVVVDPALYQSVSTIVSVEGWKPLGVKLNPAWRELLIWEKVPSQVFALGEVKPVVETGVAVPVVTEYVYWWGVEPESLSEICTGMEVER